MQHLPFFILFLFWAVYFSNKSQAVNFAVWRQTALLCLSPHNRHQQVVLSGWLRSIKTQHLFPQSGEQQMGEISALADRAHWMLQPKCPFLPSPQKLNVTFNKGMMSLNLDLIVAWFKIRSNESMTELMFDLYTSVQSAELIAIKTPIRGAVKQC